MTEHICSKKDAAAFFRVSVQALDGWFTAGCPTYERDDSGRIKSVCLEDMAEWRIGRGDEAGGLEVERIRLTKAQADKVEIEVRELRGDLIRMTAVEIWWTEIIASVRSRLLALPSRIAGQIAPPEKLQSTQDAAQAMIYEALTELASDAVPNEVRNRLLAQQNARADEGELPAAESDDQPMGKRKPRSKR